jgi:hypothetical protein
MASMKVRTGIREEYPVLRNYAYPGITLGNTEKTENQWGKNETQ